MKAVDGCGVQVEEWCEEAPIWWRTTDPMVKLGVQQVIPLPEASDYMIRIREKEERERTARKEQSEAAKKLSQFWAGLLQKARARTDLHARISPSSGFYVGCGVGYGGLTLNYCLGRVRNRVELYIDRSDKEENKRIFDHFFASKEKSATYGPTENRWGLVLPIWPLPPPSPVDQDHLVYRRRVRG